MKNFVQKGDALHIIAPAGGIKSGDVVVVNNVAGVAVTDGAEGEQVAIYTTEVYRIPKATGVIEQGANVYWDATAKNATTNVTDNMHIGFAWEKSAATETTVDVKFMF